jgi:hypothetical protein
MAKSFVKEMRAFHAEASAIERDEIASRSFTRFGWLQAHRFAPPSTTGRDYGPSGRLDQFTGIAAASA